MKNHEVGFVLGLSDPDNDFLTFEFDYAYLFENTGPVSHGIFAGIGYNFEDKRFKIDDHSYFGYSYERVTNDYFYLGAGYKLNLYFINLKLGYALPLSQSYDTNISELHFNVKHLLLFQLGLNFRF